MPMLIVNESSYSNEDAIYNVQNYIFNTERAPAEYINSWGTNSLNVQTMYNHFQLIQKTYNKTPHRKIRHFVISFSRTENITIDGINYISQVAVNYFGLLGHQAVSAIHIPMELNQNAHIHIAVNTVNVYNGSMYSATYSDSTNFFNYMKENSGYNLDWGGGTDKK